MNTTEKPSDDIKEISAGEYNLSASVLIISLIYAIGRSTLQNELIGDLLSEFGVSSTFNIADLKPYLREEDKLDSRTTPIQEGG